VFMFVSIGQLLFVLHQTRGGDMEGVRSATVFMEFIVNELPAGFRGLAMTGVLAAAVSTLNSSYNSMASVVVSDFYTPLVPGRSDRHYVAAGRLATVVLALILLVTALVCYQWQSASGVPLLAFALQMMVYAYAGLIGVFAVAVMTRRGSAASIIAAMFTGFAVTLALDPTIADMIGLTGPVANLAFPWSLTLGSICAFLAGLTGNRRLNRARPGPVGTG
jgi:solute:Na+ symporter, SSS family